MINQFVINTPSSLKRFIQIFSYFSDKKISNLFLQHDKEKNILELNIDNNINNNIKLYNLIFEVSFFESFEIENFVLIPINSIFINLKKIKKNKKSFPLIKFSFNNDEFKLKITYPNSENENNIEKEIIINNIQKEENYIINGNMILDENNANCSFNLPSNHINQLIFKFYSKENFSIILNKDIIKLIFQRDDNNEEKLFLKDFNFITPLTDKKILFNLEEFNNIIKYFNNDNFSFFIFENEKNIIVKSVNKENNNFIKFLINYKTE